jgi:uncharacterized protein YaeQ
MALTATVYRLEISLSDVDRGCYEQLDVRVARHPSESGRYFWLRVLAYCLCFEPDLAFSKGGLSDADEPPLSLRDATGVMRCWIDVGSPSAERLHRASKAADRVVLFTTTERALLEREVATRKVHALEEIEVNQVAPDFVEKLEERLAKHLRLELVRNGGVLYATIDGRVVEGAISELRLEARA